MRREGVRRNRSASAEGGGAGNRDACIFIPQTAVSKFFKRKGHEAIPLNFRLEIALAEVIHGDGEGNELLGHF